MGLSIATAAGIALFALLYVSATSLQSLLSVTEDTSSAAGRAATADRERQAMSISVTGLQLDMVGKKTIAISLANTGTAGRLYDFRHFDVILKYRATGANSTSTLGPAIIEVPVYLQGQGGGPQALPAGMWTIDRVSPDSVNPGMIDPGETATLITAATYEVYTGQGGYVEVTVSTDSGAVATRYVSY
jgi:hypothetical protein